MPTRDTAWPNGTPCWIDYGAADVDAAKIFYTDVLGWTYTGGEPEYGGYLTCEVNGRAAAGLAPQMDPSDPPRWTTYFATDDADATAARITEAGGTVLVAPMDVGPMGRMAIALDRQGNVFGLWQAAEHTGVRIHDEPGALVWTEAAVDDQHGARAFYSAVFGFHFDEIEDMDGTPPSPPATNCSAGSAVSGPARPRAGRPASRCPGPTRPWLRSRRVAAGSPWRRRTPHTVVSRWSRTRGARRSPSCKPPAAEVASVLILGDLDIEMVHHGLGGRFA